MCDQLGNGDVGWRMALCDLRRRGKMNLNCGTLNICTLQCPEEPAQSSAGRAVKGPVGVRLPEHGQGVGCRGGHGAAGTGGVRVVELWLAGGSCELLRREVDGGAAELPGAGRQDRAGPGRKRKMFSYQIWFILLPI